MAPELTDDDGVVGVVDDNVDQYKLDIYSFGIVMWGILYREIPYADANRNVGMFELLRQIRDKRLRPSEEDGRIPVQLQYMVKLYRRCWSETPAERPTAADIVAELEAAAATGEVAAADEVAAAKKADAEDSAPSDPADKNMDMRRRHTVS
jgi:hypothetical protein